MVAACRPPTPPLLSLFFLSFPSLARGRLDKLEGPTYGYAASRVAELRRKAREEARARDRRLTAATSHQNEAEESDESEDESAGERTTLREGVEDVECRAL